MLFLETRHAFCQNCFESIQDSDRQCSSCGYKNLTKLSSRHYLKPGTVLNKRYLIGRVLGNGGFGVTYLGFDFNQTIRVAIKEYLPLSFAGRGENQLMVYPHDEQNAELFHKCCRSFINEAQILFRLRHPNIVRVLSFFETNNTGYFTMPFIEGRTLAAHIQEQDNKLPWREALDIITPLLGALKEIHGQSCYHRDIKPSNIYLSEDGIPILFDFGAAKQIYNEKTYSFSNFVSPHFSPYELYFSTSNEGPWTDIYALGATFYFMVTGKVPPEVPWRLERNSLKSPSELGIEIDLRVEQAILWALEVYQKDRPQSIEEWKKKLFGKKGKIRSQNQVILAKAHQIRGDKPSLEKEEKPKIQDDKLSPAEKEEERREKKSYYSLIPFFVIAPIIIGWWIMIFSGGMESVKNAEQDEGSKGRTEQWIKLLHQREEQTERMRKKAENLETRWKVEEQEHISQKKDKESFLKTEGRSTRSSEKASTIQGERVVTMLEVKGAQTERKVLYSQSTLIDSDPPGADIFFNGEYTKRKTPHEFLIPVGQIFQVYVSKNGYIPDFQTIHINQPDEKQQVVFFKLRKILLK